MFHFLYYKSSGKFCRLLGLVLPEDSLELTYTLKA